MLKIDFICIGSELLQGKTQDLNLFYLAKKLFQSNLRIRTCHVVADTEQAIHDALEQSLKDCDICITTGGLGPTRDDITKKSLGSFLSLKESENPEALQTIRKHYLDKGREYDQENYRYHFLPKGFKALYNSVGYAPGLYFENKNYKIFSLPGVPAEFQAFVSEQILPALKLKGFLQKNLIYKTWRLPEAAIFSKLDPNLWDQLEPFGDVSSLPHQVGVDIGVTLTGKNTEEISQKEKEVDALMMSSPISKYIWQKGPLKINEYLLSLCKEKKLTFATAESCTGGLIASLITDLPGSSEVFKGAAITYETNSKTTILGVPKDVIEQRGVVSPDVALLMAQRVKEKFSTQYAISTTGVAGPTGGTKKTPVGTVVIGVSTPTRNFTETFHLKANRKLLKLKFAELAMHLLRDAIES